jgi:hypothetical protein
VELTRETRSFLAEVFDSVESVEIVLLLRRSPDTFWTSKAVASVLGVREDLAAKKLSALDAAKLLTCGESTGAYRYAPGEAALASRVDELADVYAGQRIDVINLIYSSNLERLRAFSNAFKVNGE